MTDDAQTAPVSLSVRDRAVDLTSPVVMGILNVTPDSFSDGGNFNTLPDALSRIGEMAAEGADIVDVGGESTRPGSKPVTVEEEMDRVMPVLNEAVSRFPELLFSVDTTKYLVASEALAAGVHIVNDVSGLRREPRLADLCVEYGAALVIMHSQGDPETMQEDPRYGDVTGDIRDFFRRQVKAASERGLESIILDPGIGFGKTLRHNLEILAKLDNFTDLGYPLMVGASRKSMFDRLLEGRETDERLAGTLAAHYHAMTRGAKILRVHDVRQAKDTVEVFNALGGQ